MYNAYIIECGEVAAGIVTREKRGYLFHAAVDAFRPLEGQTFDTLQKAQHAAAHLRSARKPATSAKTLEKRAKF
jgi:hypothetical protein